MAIPVGVQPFITIGIGALIAWRVYMRVRRAVGRQKYSKRRAWMAVVFYPLILAMVVLGALVHPEALLALVGGIVVGATLGIFGIRHTKFEAVDGVDYYTPNAHIGIALSLLLVGRVLYRLFDIFTSTGGFTHPPSDFVRSPLTLLIVGTVLAYYFTYAIGLIRAHATAAVRTAP